jgi:hypothetical protein
MAASRIVTAGDTTAAGSVTRLPRRSTSFSFDAGGVVLDRADEWDRSAPLR